MELQFVVDVGADVGAPEAEHSLPARTFRRVAHASPGTVRSTRVTAAA
jgi:hypothetical protein